MNKKTAFITLLALACTYRLMAQETVTRDQVSSAEKLYDLHFTDAKRDSTLDGLAKNTKTYAYFPVSYTHLTLPTIYSV